MQLVFLLFTLKNLSLHMDEISDHEGVMLSGSVEEETTGGGPFHKE